MCHGNGSHEQGRKDLYCVVDPLGTYIRMDGDAIRLHIIKKIDDMQSNGITINPDINTKKIGHTVNTLMTLCMRCCVAQLVTDTVPMALVFFHVF